MERGRQLQAGIAAERDIQLPLPHTRLVHMGERQEQEVARAQELRRDSRDR
jgi:membrane protein